jgi:hypothetical protein
VTFPFRPSSDRSPAFHLSESADWPALLQSRANVLVCGVAEATESFLRKALPYLGTPLQNIACEGGVIIAADAVTVVLRNVEILTGAEQRMLLDWIDHQPEDRKTQIISVTPAPLYAYVQAQVFAEALYYRLNAIYLEVFPING